MEYADKQDTHHGLAQLWKDAGQADASEDSDDDDIIDELIADRPLVQDSIAEVLDTNRPLLHDEFVLVASAVVRFRQATNLSKDAKATILTTHFGKSVGEHLLADRAFLSTSNFYRLMTTESRMLIVFNKPHRRWLISQGANTLFRSSKRRKIDSVVTPDLAGP